jgi:lipopolysaccharide/colanic/teichoic acid biosynthesis glycosyltransferase
MKRIFDILASLGACILLFPLFAAIALAIKATSAGPILYRWPVVGKDGRRIHAYKFRSMVIGADSMKDRLAPLNEATWPMFKLASDPRVTPLGRILRKFSLDELPQMWSVLKGDISLVGPRPVLITEWDHFTESQRRKLSVKPGAVSLWHVSGQPRDLDTWLKMDFEYIDRWSLGLDFRILARAVGYLLLGKNC